MSGPTGPETSYADAATQTSPFNLPASISPACPANPITSFLTATSLNSLGRLRPVGSSPEKELLDASSVDCTPAAESFGLDLASPRLPLLPSSSSRPQRSTGMGQATTRAVSLPDTLHDEDLCHMLSQLAGSAMSDSVQQSRVVSMPAFLPTSETRTSLQGPDKEVSEEISLGELDTESSDSAISSTPSTPRTIVVHSLNSDLLDTPSPPPSSCDSVEFTLEDPVLLPDSFLRSSVSPPIFMPENSNKAVTVLEDDGWITWASSPPRPIPALHGPSSLPYARCPSGAEGTIIEEQSSMSRMIWGLDPNDTPPTPLVLAQQPPRVDSIKASNDIAPNGYLDAPTTKSHLSSFPSPAFIPRSGLGDTMYNQIQAHQSLRVVSAVPGFQPDEGSDGIFRGMKKEGTGLGLLVTDVPAQPGAWNGHGFNAGAMNYSQYQRHHRPDPVNVAVEMLSVDEDVGEQRTARPAATRRHPSDLIDLFSSPIKTHAHNPNKNSRTSSTSRSATDLPGYLPTPPNSSSPQWSSVFSPVGIRNSHFIPSNFGTSGNDPSANYRMLSKMGVKNDELSYELRRFFFENLSSANPVNLRASPIAQVSSVPPYAFIHSNHSFIETPSHPPGIPIPDHLVSSQLSRPVDVLPGKSALSQSLTPPSPTTTTYKRSTLSNPRSIPLSRLRQNQKRDTGKLATVLEEDPETSPHDRWLVLPLGDPAHASRRTLSPLPDQLQPQSIEKTMIEEDTPKAGTARVKLPYIGESRTGDIARGLELNESTTPRQSPKKKRLQRRRKPGIAKTTESSRGFPLISEGTVSFGSSNARGPQVDAQKMEGKQIVNTSHQTTRKVDAATRCKV